MSAALQKIGPQSIDKQQDQVEALSRVLQQGTPKEAIRWRQGKGGRQLAYVDHVYVTKTLNDAFGWRWSFEVDNELIQYVNDLPFEATCRGKLTVWLPGIDVPVVKMQMGCQPIELMSDKTKPVSIGDAMKGSASDALKKCASLLGIALDLYDSDHDARQNPSTEQMRQQVEPMETDARKIAMQAQAPLKKASAALGHLKAINRELRDVLGVSEAEIKAKITTLAPKPLSELTEDEKEMLVERLTRFANETRVEIAKRKAQAK